MNVKYIVLYMGYVESGSVSGLILENQTNKELEPKQALESLVSGMFYKYLMDNSHALQPRDHLYRECCKKTIASSAVAKFCIDCGNKFDAEPIESNDFSDFIRSLVNCTADDWGGGDIPGWWPWVTVSQVMKNAIPEEILEIPESAEQVLPAFLKSDMVPERYSATVKSWEPQYYKCNVQDILKKYK